MTEIEDEILYVSENDIWKFVTKSISRVLYDAVATHEAFDSSYIPVAWLRDYADDISINFPRIRPEDIAKNNKKVDIE